MGEHRSPDAVPPMPAGVERLLAELSDLRLLLDSDLTIAAAALDADAPKMAAEVLSDEHERLNSLQARLLRGVAPVTADAAAPVDLSAELAAAHAVGVGTTARSGHEPVSAVVPMQRRRISRLSSGASAALAAAAVAAAVLGAAAIPAGSSHERLAAAAAVDKAVDTYDAFSRIATSESGDASDVQAAAAALHASIVPLINAAGTNTETAQRALELLQAEQLLLLQSKPAGAMAILREAHRLVLRLRLAAPSVVPPAATKPLTTAPEPSTKPSPKPTATKSPSPTPSPSPRKSAKASSSPKATPSSSASPSPTGLIPGL